MWYDPFDLVDPRSFLNRRIRLNIPSDDIIPQWPSCYYRPWSRTWSQPEEGVSTMKADENKFQVSLDVQQFQPEEITVKVSDDNMVIVVAKHEERPDEHGFISRQFVRKYIIPKDHDLNRVQSNLSSDGVLTITAPKKEAIKHGQREILIQQTGQPSRVIEKKTEATKQEETKPVGKNIDIKTEVEKKPEEKTSEPGKEENPVEIKQGKTESKKEETPTEVTNVEQKTAENPEEAKK